MFKTPKPVRREYKPRFYDPRKEELEKRVSRHQRLKDGDPEAIKEGISGAFRRNGRGGGGDYFAMARVRQRATFRRNLILFVLVVILTAACYVVLNVYLPAL